jgi:hypothetical protein
MAGLECAVHQLMLEFLCLEETFHSHNNRGNHACTVLLTIFVGLARLLRRKK